MVYDGGFNGILKSMDIFLNAHVDKMLFRKLSKENSAIFQCFHVTVVEQRDRVMKNEKTNEKGAFVLLSFMASPFETAAGG